MAIVLMYHSTGAVPAATDIFDLHVEPELFRQQIRFLANHYDILPLSELCSDARNGRASPRSLAITFDDGYANNLSIAAPILKEFRAQATLFVCTGFLGRESFWWDELAQVVLTAMRVPTKLGDIDPAFSAAERFLGEIAAFDGGAAESKAGVLKQLVIELWGGLRLLSLDRIYSILRELDWRFGSIVDLTTVRPLRVEEMELAADAFSIGAHTVTHPFLSSVDDDQLRFEISESQRACRALSGQPVDCFSYPFGDVDQRVAREVAAHVSLACTVQEGVIDTGGDALRIPRIQVPAWTPHELKSKLDGVARSTCHQASP